MLLDRRFLCKGFFAFLLLRHYGKSLFQYAEVRIPLRIRCLRCSRYLQALPVLPQVSYRNAVPLIPRQADRFSSHFSQSLSPAPMLLRRFLPASSSAIHLAALALVATVAI